MNEKPYKIIYNDDGRPMQIKHGFTELNSLEDVVDELNDLNSTIHYHIKTINKLKSLLDEKVEPTYDDYYLDIDMSTKRCKYENTFICNKCGVYSKYFLDCRLMMEDNQYQKALELGLVKEND